MNNKNWDDFPQNWYIDDDDRKAMCDYLKYKKNAVDDLVEVDGTYARSGPREGANAHVVDLNRGVRRPSNNSPT